MRFRDEKVTNLQTELQRYQACIDVKDREIYFLRDKKTQSAELLRESEARVRELEQQIQERRS